MTQSRGGARISVFSRLVASSSFFHQTANTLTTFAISSSLTSSQAFHLSPSIQRAISPTRHLPDTPSPQHAITPTRRHPNAPSLVFHLTPYLPQRSTTHPCLPFPFPFPSFHLHKVLAVSDPVYLASALGFIRDSPCRPCNDMEHQAFTTKIKSEPTLRQCPVLETPTFLLSILAFF